MVPKNELKTIHEDENYRQERSDFWMKRVEEVESTYSARQNTMERVRPHMVVRILMMIESGSGRREISKECQVNSRAIARIRERYHETIQESRKEFSRKFANATTLAVEAFTERMHNILDDEDELKKVNPKDLAIAVGVFTDKGLLMDGEATSIHEVRKGNSMEDAAAMIEEAKNRIARKSITVEAQIVG